MRLAVSVAVALATPSTVTTTAGAKVNVGNVKINPPPASLNPPLGPLVHQFDHLFEQPPESRKHLQGQNKALYDADKARQFFDEVKYRSYAQERRLPFIHPERSSELWTARAARGVDPGPGGGLDSSYAGQRRFEGVGGSPTCWKNRVTWYAEEPGGGGRQFPPGMEANYLACCGGGSGPTGTVGEKDTGTGRSESEANKRYPRELGIWRSFSADNSSSSAYATTDETEFDARWCWDVWNTKEHCCQPYGRGTQWHADENLELLGVSTEQAAQVERRWAELRYGSDRNGPRSALQKPEMRFLLGERELELRLFDGGRGYAEHVEKRVWDARRSADIREPARSKGVPVRHRERMEREREQNATLHHPADDRFLELRQTFYEHPHLTLKGDLEIPSRVSADVSGEDSENWHAKHSRTWGSVTRKLEPVPLSSLFALSAAACLALSLVSFKSDQMLRMLKASSETNVSPSTSNLCRSGQSSSATPIGSLPNRA